MFNKCDRIFLKRNLYCCTASGCNNSAVADEFANYIMEVSSYPRLTKAIL